MISEHTKNTRSSFYDLIQSVNQYRIDSIICIPPIIGTPVDRSIIFRNPRSCLCRTPFCTYIFRLHMNTTCISVPCAMTRIRSTRSMITSICVPHYYWGAGQHPSRYLTHASIMTNYNSPVYLDLGLIS